MTSPAEPAEKHCLEQIAPSAFWRWGKVALTATLLTLYWVTLSRGLTFSDGPEIATAIDGLGVMHPTGYPLFTMVVHGFSRLLILPLEPYYKVELFNALCGLGAALLTASATRQVGTEIRQQSHGGQRYVDIGALLAGFMLGFSHLLWRYLRIPEVYPFHLLLVSVAGWSFVRFEFCGRDRYVMLSALAMGCGLAHHVTMVYMLPAALVYLLIRKPVMFLSWLGRPLRFGARLVGSTLWGKRTLDSPWLLLVACLLGALPLLSYAYFLWANSHTTALSWGGIDDWDKLYNHMTGAQYRRFYGGGDWAAWWRRVLRIPVIFDEQYLPVGSAMLLAGIPVVVRRRWRISVFLLLYIALNAGHGIFYSVGDYAVYYLPALWACAIFLGIGCWWILQWTRSRPPQWRRTLIRAYVGLAIATTGGSLAGYAQLTKRVPGWLSPRGYLVLGVVMTLVGGVMLARAIRWRRQDARRRRLSAQTLPRLLLASLALVLVPTALVRAYRFAKASTYGSTYGEELATEIPPGSVLLVLGDGYLFNMWYQAHVENRGIDFVTLDIGNVKTPWYQDYIHSRYPRSCDPLAPNFAKDPAAYQQRCGTFRQRLDLDEKRSWASLGLKAGAKGRKPVVLTVPVVRGADDPCVDPTYFKEHHQNDCRCWKLGKVTGSVETDCGHSDEEGGIVPLDGWEVLSHRIIEDMIGQRPVYERHVFTFWDKGKGNPRKWKGPRHQRVSGRYTLINRGRFNQIVHYRDVAKLDPCASESYVELPLRSTRTSHKRNRKRLRYQPNPRPTLIDASYLANKPSSPSDESTRSFTAGEAVYLKLGWFEKWIYDAAAKGRRGDRVHHGIRVCFYDPDGHRLAVETTVTNSGRDELHWQSSVGSKPGRYRVRACSVGELGAKDAAVPENTSCTPVILDYSFTVEPPRDRSHVNGSG
ncbi:MAG: hypothetical protein DRI90_09800 [Deltaproteobacteria bacterium]|nr:MAG: hypothetical protein DRI90_09800 [Deltaproteobacteria bacterium]